MIVELVLFLVVFHRRVWLMRGDSTERTGQDKGKGQGRSLLILLKDMPPYASTKWCLGTLFFAYPRCGVPGFLVLLGTSLLEWPLRTRRWIWWCCKIGCWWRLCCTRPPGEDNKMEGKVTRAFSDWIWTDLHEIVAGGHLRYLGVEYAPWIGSTMAKWECSSC